jgi:predicted NodU family carbamoyl transferase
MNILGINAYHANSSAALVCDGRLVTAVEEERFNPSTKGRRQVAAILDRMLTAR